MEKLRERCICGTKRLGGTEECTNCHRSLRVKERNNKDVVEQGESVELAALKRIARSMAEMRMMNAGVGADAAHKKLEHLGMFIMGVQMELEKLGLVPRGVNHFDGKLDA